MPPITQQMIPGIKGKDYRFVKYAGKIYVVYQVKLPNGKVVRMSWRVDPNDYKALGVDPGKVGTITRAQHDNLAFFGSASEIAGGPPGEHPFQKYLRKLRELHGNVSWLSNRPFMEVMLMGYAEGWSEAELRQRLTRTKWYQNRTAAERAWELDMSRAERSGAIKTWNQRMIDALEELYGPNMTLREAGIDLQKLKTRAEQIASGKWGDPSEGFELWLAQQRDTIENIEGTTAWIERQQTLEEQRAFMNRPEDVFEQIRQDAMQWLGPKGLPDRDVLRQWAEDLVSEKRSEGDWQKFLRKQAVALYPWLGPDETWQDRASTYKNIAEEELGRPIGWDSPLLYQLGATDPSGAPTNAPLSYDDFARVVRTRDEWWEGPTARQEGFDLFNYMNNVFNGVSV